ncbi:hypothetical protein B9Z55_001519 [Caenorhabditis nigoni]|uniref:Uncharacterized protein n=1 Tax=Caenorhabditis nigoni TaxID=1611254 RepID=A0A2G5VG58_9PELO|nr:hypothetical protein B9Z55_001519 [Caenorhabditis nigoni]
MRFSARRLPIHFSSFCFVRLPIFFCLSPERGTASVSRINSKIREKRMSDGMHCSIQFPSASCTTITFHESRMKKTKDTFYVFSVYIYEIKHREAL